MSVLHFDVRHKMSIHMPYARVSVIKFLHHFALTKLATSSIKGYYMLLLLEAMFMSVLTDD